MNVDILSPKGEGYCVMMDFETWRIGYMQHSPAYTAAEICQFQRHETCDEAFLLLKGSCCLLVGDGTDEVGTIQGIEMQPYQVYNIHRGVWHSHLVDEDTAVLVVENSDVTVENSPLITLDRKQREQLENIQRKRRSVL